MSSNQHKKPVFADARGHRRKVTSYTAVVSALVVTVFLALFVISVLVNPFLPQIKLKPVNGLPHESDLNLPVPEAPLSKKEIAVRQIADRARSERQKREQEKAERLGRA